MGPAAGAILSPFSALLPFDRVAALCGQAGDPFYSGFGLSATWPAGCHCVSSACWLTSAFIQRWTKIR